MKLTRNPTTVRSMCCICRMAALVVLSGATGFSLAERTLAAGQLVLWDTMVRLADRPDLHDRADWQQVPSDLLTLEADPPKASSDPGYYGRSYAFKGDAVVENDRLLGVFSSAAGRVILYSKPGTTPSSEGARSGAALAKKLLEFVPVQAARGGLTISRCEILRNGGDEVALEATFAGAGSTGVSAGLFFGKDEIVEVRPAAGMKGARLVSAIEYGIVPSFIGDDLIYRATAAPSSQKLCLPSENAFIGLVQGEESEFVMTWPKGKQQIRLQTGADSGGRRLVEAIDFDNDGQSFYLAGLCAPGIWHRELLGPSYLEKAVAISWKRPFAAKWKTQLDEAGVKTTFAFHRSAGQVWRGVPGSYSYPVWFKEDEAFYHLSKKVPPKGESLIYFLEGQETPFTITTPVDVMKATLGRQLCESILDVPGRRLRTHHRRGGEGVRRACTCGCTEAIQAIFEAGEETEKQDYIKGALEDMVYFVQHHVDRINEYQQFADEMTKFLQAKVNSAPELKAYVETVEPIAQQIRQEYDVQKENMKSLDYAGELTRKTLALASNKAPDNLKNYMELLKLWRGMGGAQDYVVAQCHTITRKLAQEAGYACVDQPKAAELAREIRSRCRQILRNPDGYEIWADY